MNEIERLPIWERPTLYRKIAKMAEEYFEDPENERNFRKWLRERRKMESGKLKENPSAACGGPPSHRGRSATL